jgi:MoaA/NifB/PqqE/SkfB family radical SAM enzyme
MDLKKKGCKVVFMVEYVPVGSDLKELAPGDEERSFMDKRLLYLRQNYENMIFIYFPGDEKVTGGCLAAGRGFFHINPSGSAEPCPFSPYSDTNLKEVSVLEALRSPLFRSLADNQILMKEHVGGCVLFEQEEEVRKLASLI